MHALMAQQEELKRGRNHDIFVLIDADRRSNDINRRDYKTLFLNNGHKFGLPRCLA